MERKRLPVLFFCILFVVGMMTGEPSWAQVAEESTPANQGTEKPAPAKGEDGWRFLIAPYLWVTGVQGSTEGKDGKKLNVNVTVGEALSLIDELEFILGGRIEINKGRWGFIFDGFGEKLKGDDNILRIRDSRFPILVPPQVPIQGQVEITTQMMIMQAALSYDVYRSTKFVGQKPELTIQAMAGARYTYLSTGVEYALTGPLLGFQTTVFGSKNWIDPTIGGRLLWNPHRSWQVNLEADIGGFGAGSDFSSNLNAGVFYRIADWLLLWGGYRGLYTDYNKNNFKFNGWIHGPFMGVGFEF